MLACRPLPLPYRLRPFPVGRQVGAGAAHRLGAVLGAHGIDGCIAGEFSYALVDLELAGLAAEAAEA